MPLKDRIFVALSTFAEYGDEPLLLPRHIDTMIKSIKENQNKDAWNATGEIKTEDELNSYSFVKCAVINNNNS